jgi:chaperonin GroES
MNTKTSKLNIQPAPGYLLLEPVGAEEKTVSGIYLPDNAGEKPQQAKVLAVGDEETTENGTKKKSPVKEGQKVIYKKWGGNEVKLEGKDYLFAKFDDILATVN